MKRRKLILLLMVITLVAFIPTIVAMATDGTVPEEFYSWEIVGTYAGCLAVTMLLTQFAKPLWPQKWRTQYLSYLIALILLNGANLALGSWSWFAFALNFINGVVVSWGANGGFNNITESKPNV